jgi:hypothetical protein
MLRSQRDGLPVCLTVTHLVTLKPSNTAKIIDRQAIHADPPTRLKIEDAEAGALLVTYEGTLPPRSTYSLIVAKTPYQELAAC